MPEIGKFERILPTGDILRPLAEAVAADDSNGYKSSTSDVSPDDGVVI